MTQALTDAELEHLLKFVGYGNLDASVWFLGMEEAGGGETNIRARLQFRQVEDNLDAHDLLGITKHHLGKKVIQRTWRGMCYIMLRLEGANPSTENIRNYQAAHLGRFHGSSLLCELMPLPKPNVASWNYEELIPQFTSRNHYYQAIKPRRVQHLRQLLDKHHPGIVIGYGKNYWPDYQELFWGADFKSEGQFAIAKDAKRVVLLTDHFTARSMNGKFEGVVELVKDYYSKPYAG